MKWGQCNLRLGCRMRVKAQCLPPVGSYNREPWLSVAWLCSSGHARPGTLEILVGNTRSSSENAKMDAQSTDPELSYMTGWKTAWRAEQKIVSLKADICTPCNPDRLLGMYSTERSAKSTRPLVTALSAAAPNQMPSNSRMHKVEYSPHRVFYSNEDEQSRQM